MLSDRSGSARRVGRLLLGSLAPSLLLVAAMVVGAAVGLGVPGASAAIAPLVDPLIVALVTLLFIDVRLGRLSDLRRSPRLVAVILAVNFVVAPLVAYALSSMLVVDEAIRLGLLIYCLFPCTDWFLAFTRAAGGDTRTGAAIIPLSLILQLTLFPLFVSVFASEAIPSTANSVGATLLSWFLIPVTVAIVIRLLLRVLFTPERAEVIRTALGRAVPAVLALMVACLFAANVSTLAAHGELVPITLLVVATFFVIVGVGGELLARALRMTHPERALLVISTSARNAPLMLALTALTLPDQPLIAAVIVVGMLLEFPHLTVVSALLRQSSGAEQRGDPVGHPVVRL